MQNSGPGMSAQCTITNPSQTTSPKMISCTGSYLNAGGTITPFQSGGYWNGGNGAVTGFQVDQSGPSNITSGTVKIYGWK